MHSCEPGQGKMGLRCTMACKCLGSDSCKNQNNCDIDSSDNYYVGSFMFFLSSLDSSVCLIRLVLETESLMPKNKLRYCISATCDARP